MRAIPDERSSSLEGVTMSETKSRMGKGTGKAKGEDKGQE